MRQCTAHPSSRGESEVPLAFQSQCVASGQKVWNMACPIQISSVKWWLWRKVRCTPVKVDQCRISKGFGVAAHVLWSWPPWLPLICFVMLGLSVFPTFCCSWCLSICCILTPAVIVESKCEKICLVTFFELSVTYDLVSNNVSQYCIGLWDLLFLGSHNGGCWAK